VKIRVEKHSFPDVETKDRLLCKTEFKDFASLKNRMVTYIFTIRSPVFDIHGVQLRESIRMALYIYSKTKGIQMKGRIFNERTGMEQCVKIELFHSDINPKELEQVIVEALDNKIIKFLNSKLDKEIDGDKNRLNVQYGESGDQILQKSLEMLDSIVILRDKDASEEAAWALQGAGKVFLMVSEQITKRDEQKVRNRIAGLFYELILNLQYLREILGDSEEKFMTNALNKFLIDLPMGNESEDKKTLIRLLQDLSHDLDSINHSTNKAKAYETEEKLKNEIDYFGKRIANISTQLKKQYKEFGGNEKDLLSDFEKSN
jgi:hypothetical protein